MSLRNGNSTLPTKFMASIDSYDDASIVMAGVPMDFTCSFRPGTRFGPQKIREVSIGIEEYSVYMDRDLTQCSFFDAGDLDLPFGDVDKSLKLIGDVAEEILSDNKFPLFIGGEHLISVPVIKKVYEKYGPELIVVQFDAHADLREGYLGCPNSHASAVRRLIDFMPGKNIYQFGIRSGTKDEFEYAKKHTNMYTIDVFEPLSRVLDDIKDKPIYITLDIDVVDPAYANGTGTPEPGGISSRELLDSIHLFKGANLVGFDIVEVSPHYDQSDRTALLAAKIIREIIMMVG
ncbi:MAG TPA: agmatinase [Hungateiclostridium thermocellum]|jgi:agmatinase|uniref:Agmatinase n=2 Tax=Acetivibrio thermocellus TaxID=1515 RepID=A3DDA1_ACET2|nr:agmatinase [Acetivibrio thermocellus]CDG35387.1 Agmatinase [Acetivibrio thermocellus BC1]ABN51930.1 agmatinase [Acetivibrio thermocellus ATCC 27405]ADU74591.1 agmatinase [Acetivibrio thermocellus DSM 1313]ALX08535.1 agmatinase [Acetivibrio thermocellus AD2]ANV76284.1 agmatinase [Acetivibrio thermocellus DSM 2360]